MTILELTAGWKPKNKAKHQACQQKVKNRVSVWPSAYASAQVVQCYYGQKKKIKETKLSPGSPEYLEIIKENHYNSADRELILELFDMASLSNIAKDLANQLKLPQGLDQLKSIGKKIVDKIIEKIKTEKQNVAELLAFCQKISSGEQVTNDEKIKAGLQLARLVLMVASALDLAATGGLGTIVINLIQDQIKSKGIEIALQYLGKITGIDLLTQIADIAADVLGELGESAYASAPVVQCYYGQKRKKKS